MKPWKALILSLAISIAPIPLDAAVGKDWALHADYVDACSCDMSCPCLRGGSPTHGYCKGATLLEIRKGHYGNVDLSGITVLAIYKGGEWIRFVVSDNASREQTEAVAQFLPEAEGFFAAPVSDTVNAHIEVTRSDNTVEIKTEGTVVILERVVNSYGEPIKTQGLPAHGFPGLPYLDHTQYRTVMLSHDGPRDSFRYSGTNGYTAIIDATRDAHRPARVNPFEDRDTPSHCGEDERQGDKLRATS